MPDFFRQAQRMLKFTAVPFDIYWKKHKIKVVKLKKPGCIHLRICCAPILRKKAVKVSGLKVEREAAGIKQVLLPVTCHLRWLVPSVPATPSWCFDCVLVSGKKRKKLVNVVQGLVVKLLPPPHPHHCGEALAQPMLPLWHLTTLPWPEVPAIWLGKSTTSQPCCNFFSSFSYLTDAALLPRLGCLMGTPVPTSTWTAGENQEPYQSFCCFLWFLLYKNLVMQVETVSLQRRKHSAGDLI